MEFTEKLFDSYDRFKEPALRHRRFKHQDILPLIERRGKGRWTIVDVGESYEGRKIQLLRIGSGKRKLLFWSQMHGDESTATAALFDIFNFLETEGDEFDLFRGKLFQHVSLFFVPMLNPDGAERFQRMTAQNIDMNRDALALQTPEANILKSLIDSLKPDFGFNLHDQHPLYAAGRTSRQAALSFLATAFDFERSVNETRRRAMQLIGLLNKQLQPVIPGQIGRFSDEHEPRAFGDNIQKWGTTLVLVESGAVHGDIEKQYVRKLNFLTLILAMKAVSEETYAGINPSDYEAIPLNTRCLFDLIIRDVTIQSGGRAFKTDIGINCEERNTSVQNGKEYYFSSKIEEQGDLQFSFGLEELSASGLTFEAGKLYPEIIQYTEELERIDFSESLGNGELFFQVTENAASAYKSSGYTNKPAHVLLMDPFEPLSIPACGEIPTFLLKKDDQICFAIVNGFVFPTGNTLFVRGNGIVSC